MYKRQFFSLSEFENSNFENSSFLWPKGDLPPIPVIKDNLSISDAIAKFSGPDQKPWVYNCKLHVGID